MSDAEARGRMEDDSWDAVLPGLLAQAGLAVERPVAVVPLSGGVSSDIVRIELAGGRRLCAKRALRKLKVASDWQAPLERNHYEVLWLRRAGEIVPGAVPQVLAEDRRHGIALLEYLPPEDYRLWKAELLAGRAEPEVAVAVGDLLGRIHAATLFDDDTALAFPTDDLIDALRFDPYLRYTAGRHPALADVILAVLADTAAHKMALVHGDVSPKNILVSRIDGHPVLLDAECAWYGDPAFDAAFCCNHLVLKAVHLPDLAGKLLRQARSLLEAWRIHLPADLRAAVDARAAALLPCLMLARVDGKSPVEYLSAAAQERVRDLATTMIAALPGSTDEALARLRTSLTEGRGGHG